MIQHFLITLTLLLLPVYAARGEGPAPPPPHLTESGRTLPLTGNEKRQLHSDRLEYVHEEGIYRADGNATLTHDGMRLRANSLLFNSKTQQMQGVGDVAFTHNQNTVFASEIEFDLATGRGILSEGKLFLEEDNYTLSGKRFTRLPPNRYLLQEASFTPCDCPDHPDWRIKASQIHVTLDQYLTAKNTVFYLKERPVFVLPYFIYPVITSRQTGLLIPQMGYSRTRGLRYGQELFLAFADHHDATLSVDWRDKTGSGGGLEYRYALSQQTRGALTAHYFNDLEKDIDRIILHYQHTQQFSERTRLHLNLHSIRPENSLLELSNTTADRALRSIESTAVLTYRGDESFAYLAARSSQDLTEQTNSVNRPYEIGWRLIEHPFGPLFFSEEVTYSRFEQGSAMTWDRMDIFPKLSIPIKIGHGITLTPLAGFRPIRYSRSTQTTFSRDIRIQGVHLRSDAQRGERFRFSQQLLYEQVFTGDQFDRLKADDIDRLHRREAVTVSLNPRWLNPKGANPLVSARFTETYHTQIFSPSTKAYSDLRGEMAIRPAPFTSFEIDTFYNWDNQNLTALNADLNIKMRDRYKLSIGEHFTRGGDLPQKGDPFNPLYLGDILSAPPSRFLRGHLLTRLSSELSLAAQIYYDQDRKIPIELHYGILYLKQCWSVSLVYQELPDRDEFSFAIHLKGLGPILPKRFAYLFDW